MGVQEQAESQGGGARTLIDSSVQEVWCVWHHMTLHPPRPQEAIMLFFSEAKKKGSDPWGMNTEGMVTSPKALPSSKLSQ